MNTGIRLRKALDGLGINIKEAGERAKIPYRSMQNYLRGEREPGAEALTLINEQLGISIDWLLTGEGPMYRPADETAPTTTLSPREQAVLELFNALDENAQREIQCLAEEKKRMSDMEKQIQELSLRLDKVNSSG